MDILLAETLASSKNLIEIDENFKLYAGPGAGKTTFLASHIRNIISKSKRLNKSRKIACITYTNTAVYALKEKLEDSMEFVEISTIHSFCYNFIVKPFIWILDECEVSPELINGHEEIKLRKSQLDRFKTDSKQYFLDDQLLNKALSKLTWMFVGDELVLKFKNVYDGKVGGYNIKKDSYLLYKSIYWEEGKLSHDDVLYFALRILKEKREVLRVIRARFPYFLIDEFQDTSPIQTEILKLICESDSNIGVIGDVCQSIYSFQGANVDLFKSFDINNMKKYIIAGNRRSTEQIIKVLNHMRSSNRDFEQFSPNSKEGNLPLIIVGDEAKVIPYIKENYQDTIFLSYKNTIREIDDVILEDSNRDRGWRIYYVCLALEAVKELDMPNALKFMKQAYRKTQSFDDKSALMNLKRLLTDYELIQRKSLKDFYNDYLVGHFNVQSKITRGSIKDFYDSITYQELISQIKKIDKTRLNYKTIHQSKGDEYEDVCIMFSEDSKEQDLSFLIEPDMENESHRVYYVAMSRAMNNLFISTKILPQEKEKSLKEIGFNILRLE